MEGCWAEGAKNTSTRVHDRMYFLLSTWDKRESSLHLCLASLSVEMAFLGFDLFVCLECTCLMKAKWIPIGRRSPTVSEKPWVRKQKEFG